MLLESLNIPLRLIFWSFMKLQLVPGDVTLKSIFSSAGSCSDRCHSPWGRRRPFLLVLCIGIILGFTLLLNGEWFGLKLGDASTGIENDPEVRMFCGLCQNSNTFLGRPLGKTLWLHASSVSQWGSECVKLLVYTFCIVHIFLMQRWIRFIFGVFMPHNVGNIMWVDMLGSKVIEGVLLVASTTGFILAPTAVAQTACKRQQRRCLD